MGKEIIVELKNDLAIRGTLQAVDQYLNIKLRDTSVVDEEKFPHMVRFGSAPARREWLRPARRSMMRMGSRVLDASESDMSSHRMHLLHELILLDFSTSTSFISFPTLILASLLMKDCRKKLLHPGLRRAIRAAASRWRGHRGAPRRDKEGGEGTVIIRGRFARAHGIRLYSCPVFVVVSIMYLSRATKYTVLATTYMRPPDTVITHM